MYVPFSTLQFSAKLSNSWCKILVLNLSTVFPWKDLDTFYLVQPNWPPLLWELWTLSLYPSTDLNCQQLACDLMQEIVIYLTMQFFALLPWELLFKRLNFKFEQVCVKKKIEQVLMWAIVQLWMNRLHLIWFL
jgi:hypothetical protein